MTPERAVELGVIDSVMSVPEKDALRANGAKVAV
jgi:hypothetical protein